MEHNAHKPAVIAQNIFYAVTGFLSGVMLMALSLKIVAPPFGFIVSLAAAAGLAAFILKKKKHAEKRWKIFAYGVIAAAITGIILGIVLFSTLVAMFENLAQ